jgi:hypothetical protein
VPASRTRFRGLSFPAGEMNNLLSCIRMQMLCCRSAGGRRRGFVSDLPPPAMFRRLAGLGPSQLT